MIFTSLGTTLEWVGHVLPGMFVSVSLHWAQQIERVCHHEYRESMTIIIPEVFL